MPNDEEFLAYAGDNASSGDSTCCTWVCSRMRSGVPGVRYVVLRILLVRGDQGSSGAALVRRILPWPGRGLRQAQIPWSKTR